MSEEIKWVMNTLPGTEDNYLKIMALKEVHKAKAFHESFPGYNPTPLVGLKQMADFLGIGSVYVKDESYRFDLKAFKVLGGSFAIARYIAERTGRNISELSYQTLTSGKIREEFGQSAFFSATDGNHGRGVAWAANKLAQKCVIFMPKGTTVNRLDNILKEGAKATIEEVNYDACVRMAAAAAKEVPNGVVVQDTAWDGYEEIPSWIMQGYGTMAMEADEQFTAAEGTAPTHVFVQAGVGSLAGAVQGYFANKYPDNPPAVIVAEASEAACLYEGAKAGDGKVHVIDTDMPTIMAGLACGEPNILSWDILKNHAAAFLSCPDWVTVKGMRMLAAPLKGDNPVTSGESGAVPFGALAVIMSEEAYAPLKELLGLDQNSKVLCFSTEGDTDPQRYQNIVWKGLDR